MAPSMDASSGSAAVKESKKAKALQYSVDVTANDDEYRKLTKTRDGKQTVKQIGVKTFYLQNGVWVDSTFDEKSKLTEVKLKFASNDYFDLANTEKDLATYLSVGKQVIVVWNNKVYRISE